MSHVGVSVPSKERQFAGSLTLLKTALPTIGKLCVRLASFAVLKTLMATGLRRAPAFHPAAVTAAYITNALRAKHVLQEGESVASVVICPMEKGGVGSVERVQLTYTLLPGSASRPPATMVMKVLGSELKDVIVGSIVPLVEQEHRAYTHPEFCRLMKGLQPVVYSFEFDSWSGMGLLLMEDLGHYRHVTSRQGATAQDLEMLLELVAKIHSKTLNQHIPTIQKDFWFRSEFIDQMIPHNCKQALNGMWGAFIRQEAPHVAKAMSALADFPFADAVFLRMNGFGVRAVADIATTRSTPFSCVIHGDARVDNCFFDDRTGRAMLVDWQVVMPRCPMLEFGWILLDAEASTVLHAPRRRGTGERTMEETPDILEASKQHCRQSVDRLLQTYLTALHKELDANGFSGERPSKSFCDEMLPWVMVNNALYLMVTIVQIIRVQPQDAATDHLALTFRQYIEKLDWLLEVFVSEGFYTNAA